MKMAAKYWAMISALLIAVSGAQAQIFFSVDFSKASGYVDGPIVGQPSNGSVQWTNANTSVNVDTFKIENEKLSTVGDGKSGKWVTITIPTQNDIFTAEFDAIYSGDGTRTNLGVYFSDSANFNLNSNNLPDFDEQGAMLRFANDNVIDARNGDGNGGGSFTKKTSVLYNDGTTIHITAVVDVLSNLVSVYAQKEGGAEETIAEDYGFRRFTNEVNCMVLCDSANDGSIADVGMILDNFVLYGTTSVVEWSLY